MPVKMVLQGARCTIRHPNSLTLKQKAVAENDLYLILRAGTYAIPRRGNFHRIPGQSQREVIGNIMHNRRLFITGAGHVGIGPVVSVYYCWL